MSNIIETDLEHNQLLFTINVKSNLSHYIQKINVRKLNTGIFNRHHLRDIHVVDVGLPEYIDEIYKGNYFLYEITMKMKIVKNCLEKQLNLYEDNCNNINVDDYTYMIELLNTRYDIPCEEIDISSKANITYLKEMYSWMNLILNISIININLVYLTNNMINYIKNENDVKLRIKVYTLWKLVYIIKGNKSNKENYSPFEIEDKYIYYECKRNKSIKTKRILYEKLSEIEKLHATFSKVNNSEFNSSVNDIFTKKLNLNVVA